MYVFHFFYFALQSENTQVGKKHTNILIRKMHLG